MLKNILYVGDMHCKQTVILPYVDKVIDKYNVSEVVFLGDYTDEFSASNTTRIEQLNYQVEWYNKKVSERFQITNLIGNHDMAYLKGDGLCSGYVKEVQPNIKSLLSKLNPVIMDYNYDVVASHAGFTETWMNVFNKTFGGFNDDNFRWNDIVSKADLYKLVVSVGEERGGFEGDVPGPLWCDANELIEDPCSSVSFQVVGHTPVKTIAVHDGMKIALCDTFSCDRFHIPLGDGSMLINQIDINTYETKHIVVNPSDVGMGTWEEMTWNLN